MSPDILGDWALTEYERIQKNAPDIQEKIMCRFKKMFGHTEMPVPDILNENFTILIHQHDHDAVDNL